MKTLLSQNNLVFNPPMLGCVLFLSGLPGSGSKIYDRSPYGNHGTITGATWKRLPSGLWYLSFDGLDDKVDCGTGDIVKPRTGDYTLKCWIKATESRTALIMGVINSSATIIAVLEYYSDNVFLRLKDASGDNSNPRQSISINTWYHIVGVRDTGAGTKSFYCNGVSSGTPNADPTDDINPSANMRLGILNYTGWKFKGHIALPECHKRAWTALDAQNSFNREKHLFGVW